MNISPDVGSKAFTLTNDRTTSPRILFKQRGGKIWLIASSTITSLTFYSALALTGGLVSPLLTAASPPVQVAITSIVVGANGAVIDLPPEVFGCPYLIIVIGGATSEAVTISDCG